MTDIARADQAPKSVFDVLRNRFAVAGMAGVAAGTLFGGITGRASGKNAIPGSNTAELANGIENPLLDNQTFNSVHNLVTARSAEASDLQGPQVQFFDVITSDNNRTQTNPNVRPFIGGLQKYAESHGDGLRVRVAQSNDVYTAPILKINMTRAQVLSNFQNLNYQAIKDEISNTIINSNFPTKDRVNVALLDASSGDSCFTLAINAPNPANVDVIDVSNSNYCSMTNSSEGFNGLNVLAAQGILWVPRTANFVRDSQDTMDDSSINGNLHNFLWYQTYINHSNTYGSSLNTSGYWQHHLNVNKSGTGNGEVTELPTPDPCKQDCGTGILYPAGTKVTIQAAAKTGSTFTGFDNCPQVSGNSCIVPMTQEQNVTVKFKASTTPPPPKPKAYVIAQELHGDRKIGSNIVHLNGDGKTIYNGKEYANGLTVVAKHVGQIVTLKFKPDKSSGISFTKPCPGEKDLTDGSRICQVPANVVDNPKTAKIEATKISVGYIKQSPPIQKSPVR